MFRKSGFRSMLHFVVWYWFIAIVKFLSTTAMVLISCVYVFKNSYTQEWLLVEYAGTSLSFLFAAFLVILVIWSYFVPKYALLFEGPVTLLSGKVVDSKSGALMDYQGYTLAQDPKTKTYFRVLIFAYHGTDKQFFISTEQIHLISNVFFPFKSPLLVTLEDD